MMFLATTSNLQEIGNKIISVGMPILISLAVVIAIIIMVAYYGIGGKFAKNAEQRKETIARITWVGVCLGIVILASSLVLGLKDVILGIS
ncbi:Mbov_0395 family pilin-like conjugal transfer protein [Spiroplasma endosymbiont of Eupeodes luniger]|uniref:Mbov_0395 family pilin-like conjugal transfer protein n=1 Tax=Spiroplasma endosymbiont of Eupeodes luniger TaxID=3066300 RepID=UPI0030CD70A8